MEAALAAVVRPGWHVVDVGAHHGTYTRLLSALVGPGGSVLALEAHPATASALGRRAASLGNVEVLQAAAAERDGTVALCQAIDGPSARWTTEADAPSTSTLTVAATTLDTALAGRRVDLLKIDVEGAEMRVLDGAEAVLAGRPLVVVEVHSEELRRTVTERFARLGYAVEQLDDGHLLAASPERTDARRPPEAPRSAARDALRTAARRLAPGFMADRARRYEQGYRERTGVTALAEALVGDGEVSGGPFAGMLLGKPLAAVDAAPAKLVGSYEAELASVFGEAVDAAVPVFVDVGCADGYYAVGMARASPATTTHAFDLAGSARRLCRETALRNGVEARVRLAGRCDAAALRGVPLGGALVLVDIEGGELAFFTPEVIALLHASRVVVEVHEDDVPGAGEALTRRFAATHETAVVRQAPRTAADHPALAALPADRRELALSEHRDPRLHWLVLTPRRASRVASSATGARTR